MGENSGVPARWLQSRWALGMLLLFATAIRLVRLEEPPELVFDETYYAKDGCLYVGNHFTTCDLNQDSEQTYVHPPLGKWLIGLGIKVFGYSPLGWRISAVVFGVALVLVVYLLAGRLFSSRWVAMVAGLLVATDFLLIVQSRIAMLDIFLAFFVVLGFLFLVRDREAVMAVMVHLNAPGTDPPPARPPTHRLVAGLAFGLALAVKWSAVYALATAALLGLAWTVALRRSIFSSSEKSRGRRYLAKDLLFTALAFGLVPLLVYVGSYSEWIARHSAESCPYTVPSGNGPRTFSDGFLGLDEGECVQGAAGVALRFADLHDRMAGYHLSLEAEHPYESKAWTWPLVLRPVAYYYEGAEGRSTEIIGIGNIVVWYAALGGLIWLVARSFRSWRPERVVLAMWMAQYLPWLLVARPLFFFYMTPVAPFMMIGLAAALHNVWQRGTIWRRLVAAFLILGVGGMLVIFYPILTAVEIDYDLWRRLMWLPHFDCGDLKCGWI